MIEIVLWLCAAFAIAFVINLVPAFMPSTWMVLAFFYIKFDLPLLVLTVGGAIVSGFGRFFLAKGSAWFREHFMKNKQADLEELGRFLDEHRRVTGPTVFVYALTPLPTNNLFIAAGMVGVNLVWVLAGFWGARVIADTFWVWTTNRAFESLGDLFEGALTGPAAIALQVLGLLSVVLLYQLPWARWLRRALDRRRAAKPTAPS